MMSSFAAKRKARVIKIDDEGDGSGLGAAPAENKAAVADAPQPVFKASRKPFRQSGLRKSINVNEEEDAPDAACEGVGQGTRDTEDESRPVVIRPTLGRSGSTKQKKRQSSSRLSFGGREPGPGGAGEEEVVVTPKKAPLAQRALENNAFRSFSNRLPVRSTGDEDDRPRYSKEYLEELQSSTPNTPRDLSSLHITDEDGMDLDSSELEGALIVNEEEFAKDTVPEILTDAQIRERKERRARLAKEQDFISLSDDEDNSGRKKDDTRLVREDEDLGEGFDEFVEDGGLSLGKKAEREARRRQRREMAELIHHAEASSEDDSDAERRAAFEAAQTRAGMDGLDRPKQKKEKPTVAKEPKMPPPTSLGELSQDLDSYIEAEEQGIEASRKLIAKLQKDIEEAESGRPDEVREALRLKERELADKVEDFQRLIAETNGTDQIGNGDRDPDNLGTARSDSSDMDD